jgi:hypothetical protein
MQASWGQDKSPPQPCRGGELYGEVGKWKVATLESIPGIYTGPEDPRKEWNEPRKRHVPVVAQSTKRPPEMDIAPAGVKVTIGSKVDVLHMADHDHGMVWPPTSAADKTHVPFMAMVKKDVDYKGAVNGIMVGYQGHVPARSVRCPAGRRRCLCRRSTRRA